MIGSSYNFYRCKYTVHFELPETIEKAIYNLEKITPILKKINKSKIIVILLEKSDKDYLNDFIAYIDNLDNGLICGLAKSNGEPYRLVEKNASIRYPTGTLNNIIKKTNNNFVSFITNKAVSKKFRCTIAMDTLKVDCLGKIFTSTCKYTQTEIEDVSSYNPRLSSLICERDLCENNEKSITACEDEIYERTLDNNNEYAVKWRLFENCNYHCPYCIQAERSKNKKLDIDKLFKTAENISSFINSNVETDKISLTLIGGEPSLLSIDDMVELIHKVNTHKKFNYIHFTTNFFRGAEYFNTIYNKINCGMKIVCSFHEDQTSIDKFLNEIYLLDKRINVVIEHVMTEYNLQESINILEEIKKRNSLGKLKVKVQFDIKRDSVGIKNITAMGNYLSLYNNIKYFDLFDNSIKTKTKGNLPKESVNDNFCGCICKSNTLVVDYDGKLYKRTCKQKQSIGNIFDINNVSFDKETMVYCPNTVCNFCEFISIDKSIE